MLEASALNTILATLALLVSTGLLVVHYRNQVERRHGELVQLRTQILSGLSVLLQRFTSLQINAELARMELRRIPDSNDKYGAIEKLPLLLVKISEFKDQLEASTKLLEQLDTKKVNNTDSLIRLQRAASLLEMTLPQARDIEQEMLDLLRDLRATA